MKNLWREILKDLSKSKSKVEIVADLEKDKKIAEQFSDILNHMKKRRKEGREKI